MRWRRDSTAWRSTLPTVTSSTSSSIRAPIGAPTLMAGPIENRIRLLMEVLEVVSEIWGPDRVGVRLSPLGTLNDIGDDGPEMTLGTIAEKLNGRRLAYLHVVNPAVGAFENGIEPDPARRGCSS